MRQRRATRGRRGNSLIEFALVFALLMPLYVWMLVFGLDLRRLMQVTQVSRDAGHMFARGVDFSLAGNQNVLVRLAAGMNMTRTGGSGVVILTRVLKVGAQECTDGGVSLASCANLGQAVITQRVVVGNANLRPSKIGTPPPSLLNPDGTVDPAKYLTQTSARASNFNSILNLADGETAYVAESWFESPVKDFPTMNNRGPIYARTIF
ncbi:MAG: hypothetical protein NZR01_02045 [Bryobacteraceae bacterium]|nr:hypothetical protein [Bryobacteraceae bacterium]